MFMDIIVIMDDWSHELKTKVLRVFTICIDYLWPMLNLIITLSKLFLR